MGHDVGMGVKKRCVSKGSENRSGAVGGVWAQNLSDRNKCSIYYDLEEFGREIPLKGEIFSFVVGFSGDELNG